jgi:hypothetical protein
MHQARDEPLEQLALAEHDRRLVAGAPADPTRALDGRRRAQDPNQPPRTADEQPAAQRDRSGERDGGWERGYLPIAFLISSQIAGTTSCTSPTTP